jgi:energy-coupling factor transporter ATP-binding protein EcfA2
MNSNLSGSSWNKWDLHVHTPDSIVNEYSGPDAWDRYIDELSQLPSEFKVLGINDYIFLDGYKKVLAAKEAGRLPNIELLLPVIELRLNKFGGSKNSLSRVNYHVIFSDKVLAETIESQFLAALRSKYILSPEMDTLRESGKWSGVPTPEGLRDLGQTIIDSVPLEEKGHYAAPIIEGFNNLCCSLEDIDQVLDSPYFKGKTLTAVGKTEWADVKWTGQSIAEKKNIINGSDLVFISSDTPENWQKSKDSLTESGVNDLLLDCSDAHRYMDSSDKDRLGKCFTWIKGDLCFETLRQALYEPTSRICISENKPLEPLLGFQKVTFEFAQTAELKSDGRHSSPFCFRGKHEIHFSPYLTCIVGGRGSGKSTALNLIHDKVQSGRNHFFKQNRLISNGGKTIDECVTIDDSAYRDVEFIQQNEIEQLAINPEEFTQAIFQRLNKLDATHSIRDRLEEVIREIQNCGIQQGLIQQRSTSERTVASEKKELVNNKRLIDSFENEDYKRIRRDLGIKTQLVQTLKSGKNRMTSLWTSMNKVIDEHSEGTDGVKTLYDDATARAVETIKIAAKSLRESKEIVDGDNQLAKFEIEAQALNAELEAFLKGRGLSEENLKDVGRASKRIAELEDSILRDEAKLSFLNKKISGFVFTDEPRNQYAKAVDDLLRPINESLSSLGEQVRPIKLEYTFDRKSARISLVEELAELIKQELSDLGEDPKLRIDHLTNAVDLLEFDKISDQGDLLSVIDDSNKTGSLVWDYFSEQSNFDDFMQRIRRTYIDVSKYRRINVYYDNRPIENSSFGQRCTAAIVVLLLLGNTPIIIDEPEAHLDSALIAKYLVNLVKDKKVERQIIFATHNANFVINGDAELIHVLEASPLGITKKESTTIENLEYRDRLLALEGGKEAFKRRENRYGI